MIGLKSAVNQSFLKKSKEQKRLTDTAHTCNDFLRIHYPVKTTATGYISRVQTT